MTDTKCAIFLPSDAFGYLKPESSEWREWFSGVLKNRGENGLSTRLMEFVHKKISSDNRVNWMLVDGEPLSASLDRIGGRPAVIFLVLCLQLASPWNESQYECVFQEVPTICLNLTGRVRNILSMLLRERPLIFWLMYKFTPSAVQPSGVYALQEQLEKLNLSTAALSQIAFPSPRWAEDARQEWIECGVVEEQAFVARLWKKILLSRQSEVHNAFETRVLRRDLPFWLHRGTIEAGLSQRFPFEEKPKEPVAMTKFEIHLEDRIPEKEEDDGDFLDRFMSSQPKPISSWKPGFGPILSGPSVKLVPVPFGSFQNDPLPAHRTISGNLVSLVPPQAGKKEPPSEGEKEDKKQE